MVTRPLTVNELREELAMAEQQFMCAEFIDQTSRQQSERAFWAKEIDRIRAEIEARSEGWSGMWKQ
jgi:hypothetical protein